MPNQIYRKSVKDGFEFNLMVCGSSGLGKSTLMNSLFLTDIYSAVSTKNVYAIVRDPRTVGEMLARRREVR